MNFDTTERTFGVELEVISPFTKRELVTKLNQQFMGDCPLYYYGKPSDVTGRQTRKYVKFVTANYSNKDNTWRVKPDVSVRATRRGHGVEIVTPILYGESDLATLKCVVAYLEHLGCTVNRTTGMHCHIDIENFDEQALRRMMMLLAKYESALNDFLPNSRKGFNNSYCRNSFRGHELLWDIWYELRDRAKEGTRKVLNFDPMYGRGKWNFQNFWNHGTFENRAHSGTVNADKVEHWVRLTMGLVLKAYNDRIVPTKEGSTTNHPDYDSKSLLNTLIRGGYISSDTKRFLNKRAKDIRNAIQR